MSISDRSRDFEAGYVNDETFRFRARVRRNELLALWAAEKLGKSNIEAKVYAREVATANVNAPTDDEVFAKIRADFDEAGVRQSDHQIQRTMSDMLAKAELELKTLAQDQ
ncbi:DUF1476 domain-containing protein [Consotaella aegiceratis]|uniref:DUF1476 domain-containing protein n=1 Tax=Consotaella aegiceratis TaxID=3097961 RepID=UPI002F40BB2A